MIAASAASFLSTFLSAKTIDPVFADHAVVQRGQPLAIWGTAAAGEKVSVTFAGRTEVGAASRDGRWKVEFPPLPAGGPHRLQVRFASGGTAEASDLLVGDVWLCSGQSNMEWPVRRSLNGEDEAARSNDPQVRLLSIPQKTALSPRNAFEEVPAWQVLTPQSAAEFSAACLFMARDLRKHHPVPFGLIDASWGGTRIRPWMDVPAARASGNADDAELLALFERDSPAAARRFAESWGDWWRQRTDDAPGKEPWNASERLDWRPVPSIEVWDEWQGSGLASFDGHVWMRKRFTLSPAQASQRAILSLGVVDDLDQTWVNGVGIGSSFGWALERNYTVPSPLLRPGINEVIVNVGDSWGPGGFQGPAHLLRLTLSDGTVIPLGSDWEYNVVPKSVSGAPRAPWDSHSGLGTLYNAMIAPLGPIKLRGVAWYQGEADVGLPGYDRRLEGMMASWRRQFLNPGLPFLVIGLAGFGQPADRPVESGWAALQDEQRKAAARDPNAALVPALDIGERHDVHPPNKQEVGRRLALAARSVAYADPAGRTAPVPVSAKRSGEAIMVEFDSPLRTLNSDRALAFEICGLSGDSCRYADARVSGKTVLVAGDGLPVSRVRYAWADFAVVNLYAGDLPVPTFEIPLP